MATDEKEPRPDSFVFYRSFYDAIEQANEQEQFQLYRGIANYALNGTEPNFKGLLRAVWLVIKPQIEANYRRYLNGCKGAEHGKKGGRPAKPQTTQRETPPKPQENPTKTPNVNYNDNVNSNSNVNNNGNVIDKPKRAPRFVAPTIEEVKEYFLTLSIPNEYENFFDYYTSNGWRVGKNPMKDWRATAKNWCRRQGQFNNAPTTRQQPQAQPNVNPDSLTTMEHSDNKDYSERF